MYLCTPDMEKRVLDPNVRLLNIFEAAAYIHHPHWNIRAATSNGYLPSVQVGDEVLIDKDVLEAWIKFDRQQGGF